MRSRCLAASSLPLTTLIAIGTSISFSLRWRAVTRIASPEPLSVGASGAAAASAAVGSGAAVAASTGVASAVVASKPRVRRPSVPRAKWLWLGENRYEVPNMKCVTPLAGARLLSRCDRITSIREDTARNRPARRSDVRMRSPDGVRRASFRSLSNHTRIRRQRPDLDDDNGSTGNAGQRCVCRAPTRLALVSGLQVCSPRLWGTRSLAWTPRFRAL